MSGSRWRDKPVVVRAPASSANLGPGFDALGLALSLHDVAVARVTGGGLDIEVSGEGSGTAATGEAHLVVQAMRAAFDVLGGQPPGLGLRSLNAIPHGRGLGSSAAAVVTGILAARGLATDGARAAARRRGTGPGHQPGRAPGQRGRVPARRADHLLGPGPGTPRGGCRGERRQPRGRPRLVPA